MTSPVSQSVRATSSLDGDASVNGTACEPGPSCYDASEIESIKRQLQTGNAIMRDAARDRGYKLHPRLANRARQPEPA